MASAEDITVHLKVEPDNSFRAMLIRAAHRFTPKTIIDVGASDGSWSKMAHEIWPDANLWMVEANPVFWPALEAFADDKRAVVVGALAGATRGEQLVRLAVDDPFQGVYDRKEGESSLGMIMSRRITIDDECVFPGPYLIKLDVHGREHEILAGARETLKNTLGLVVEVYTWSQGTNSMRAAELIPVIELAHGFLPADLCEPLRRPLDGRMVQYDCLFEPKTAVGMDTARYR